MQRNREEKDEDEKKNRYVYSYRLLLLHLHHHLVSRGGKSVFLFWKKSALHTTCIGRGEDHRHRFGELEDA